MPNSSNVVVDHAHRNVGTAQKANSWVRRSRRQRAPPKEVYNPNAGIGGVQLAPRKRRAMEKQKEEDKFYLDIHTWSKSKWDDFLLNSEKIPRRIVKRFGMPCFVRLQADAENEGEQRRAFVPALELSPLDIRGIKKHDLRRDFLLALHRYVTSKGVGVEAPHLVYLYGVKLGDSHLEEEHMIRRSRHPFALVLSSDFMNIKDALSGGYMNFCSVHKSIEEKMYVMEEMKRVGEYDLSKSLTLCEEEIIEAYCQLDVGLAKATAANRIAFIAEHYHSDDAGCKIDWGDEDESSSFSSSSSEAEEENDNTNGFYGADETLLQIDHENGKSRDLLPKSNADPEATLVKPKKEMVPEVVIRNKESPMELSSIEESRKSTEGNTKKNSVAEISFRSGSMAASLPGQKPKRALDHLVELERQYGTRAGTSAVVARIQHLFKQVFQEDAPRNKVTDNLNCLKQKMNEHLEIFKPLCDEWGVDKDETLNDKLLSLAEIIGEGLKGDSFDEKFANLRNSI